MNPILLGILLALLATLTWLLVVVGPNFQWYVVLMGWTMDAFIISTAKALNPWS